MINRMEYTSDLSSVDMKVSQFYGTCMGLEYVEQEGEKPLKRIIQQLGKVFLHSSQKPQFFSRPATKRISTQRRPYSSNAFINDKGI